MRTRLVVPTLLIVLLAACGGGTTPSSATSSAPSQPPASTAPAGNGAVDCTVVKAAAQKLLMIQLLAQLTTPDNVASIKSKQIGDLDIDAFLAAMHDLHALDAVSSALGDPKAAIDVYEQAGKAAQVLFATDPVTQAAIDTYMKNVGTVSDFLGHQVAIAGAIDAAHC